MAFPAEEVIEVHGLTKTFGAVTAVDDVSFRARRGEILGLLGPNGAGKTTTIQLLLGLTRPTSGRIRILGKDLLRHRREILQRANFSSAYISLPFNLSVRENLDVFGRLYGGPAMSLPEMRKWRRKTLVGASLKVIAPTGQYDPAKRRCGRR